MLFLPKPTVPIKKIFYVGLALGALLTSTFLTFVLGSRGPVFAVIVTLIATLALFRKSFFLFLNIGLFCVISLVGFYTFSGVLEGVLKDVPGASRIINTFKYGDGTGSFNSRIYRFEMAWEDALKSNFIGVGTGDFGKGFGDANSGYYDFQREYPHNLFLEFLAEQGIVGFTLISLFCCFVFKDVLFVIRTNAAMIGEKIVAALVLYAFLNSMVSTDLVGNYLFFVFASMTALCAHQLKSQMHVLR